VTKAASDHMDRVASLGCVLCHEIGHGYSPAEVHHIFDTAARSDFLTIPLCPGAPPRRDRLSRARTAPFEARYKTSEAKLLAATLEMLEKQRRAA
jgi:hypothetical protein